MASTSSHRGVRIADAVSVYEPDIPKTTSNNMRGSNHFVRSRNHVAGGTGNGNGNRRTGQNHTGSNTVHRQQFFLNKFFRTGTATTPYNSFRQSNSHDERSQNDESTNASGAGSVQLLITSIQELGLIDSDTANNTDSDISNHHKNVAIATAIPSPPPPPLSQWKEPRIAAADSQQQHVHKPEQSEQSEQPEQPERRKFFMDKLFTVSRMHVTEAGHQPLNHNKNGTSARNERRTTKGTKDIAIKSRILYSVEGDTTATNSSVGVDEDATDLSSTSTAGKSPTLHQPSTIVSPPPPTTTKAALTVLDNESPNTTIFMEFPMENHEVLEIQTDRLVETSKGENEAEATLTLKQTPSVPITSRVQSPSPRLYENFTFQSRPVIVGSTIHPNTIIKEVELPPPATKSPSIKKAKDQTVPKEMPKSSNDVNRNKISKCGASTTPRTATSNRDSKKRQVWQKQFFASLLDRVTKIQCITNCSDIDLARCDDEVEDYIASPLHTAAKRCSGKAEGDSRREVLTHRLSTNSIVKVDDQSSSNSVYSDDYDDDLATYDESMISASLFDTDTMDDEYTCTTFENDDEHHLKSNNNNATPILLQKLMNSDATGTTSKYMGDDDNTSAYSSQNSQWL